MTHPTSLDQIIKRWRDAKPHSPVGPLHSAGIADGLRIAADQLEPYAAREAERRKGLEALRELSEKATPGPHEHKAGKYRCDICCNAAMVKDAFETACVSFVTALLDEGTAAGGIKKGGKT